MSLLEMEETHLLRQCFVDVHNVNDALRSERVENQTDRHQICPSQSSDTQLNAIRVSNECDDIGM